MFRLLKVKPPHGWVAVIWELLIVTLGVLIAFAAQQWAEDRSWHDKVGQSQLAIRAELAKHYYWSVEWRVVEPCIVAQFDRLQQRIDHSGDRLDPAPVYSQPAVAHFVLRMPSKDFAHGAWQAAISDGAAQRFDPALRSELNDHYQQLVSVQEDVARTIEDTNALLALGRPLRLDPMVRYTLVEHLEQLRGRTEFLDLQTGQLIDHIEKARMVPSREKARREIERFGTYQFCKEQGLPMRSFVDAMRSVPN